MGSVAPSGAPPSALGGGPELGFFALLRSNVLLNLDVRVVTRRAAAPRLTRVRIAAGAGWMFTRGPFALPLTGALTVEPWWVRTVELTDTDAEQARHSPLFGIAARAAPSLRADFEGWQIRGGLALELAGSAELAGGAGVPRVRHRETGALVYQIGGFELIGGLELAVSHAL